MHARSARGSTLDTATREVLEAKLPAVNAAAVEWVERIEQRLGRVATGMLR